MTQRTVTAFFTDRSEAMQSVDRLAEAGIPRSAIRILPETGAAADTSIAGLRTDSAYTGSSTSTYSEGSGTYYDSRRDEKGFWASLAELFMPDEDRHSSAEAMHRGDIMVTATVDDSMAAKAEDILEEYGTVNIAERETAWRSGGWKGYGDTGSTRSTSPGGEGVFAIAEETLRVGKRAVDPGRVKVRSYVVETPVSEDVSLRDETVHIDRRPADRKLTDREAGICSRNAPSKLSSAARKRSSARLPGCARKWPWARPSTNGPKPSATMSAILKSRSKTSGPAPKPGGAPANF